MKTCEFVYRAEPDDVGCDEQATRLFLVADEVSDGDPEPVEWLLCEEHAALLRHDVATGMVLGLVLLSDEAVAA